MAKGYTLDAARIREASDRVRGTHCAIITRYYGATNTRGARIVARLAGEGKRPRVSIGFPYELDELGRHTAAALALLDSMRREGDAYAPELVSAGAIEGGYAFTLDTPPAY
jgi:cell division GTPase FtsZ